MKIYLHLLAAGLSRRFGDNKLLLPWRGSSLLQHSISRYLRWQRCLVDILPDLHIQIIITTTEERKAWLSSWLEQELMRLDFTHKSLSEPIFVINPHPENGQASSIRLSTTAALTFDRDQPAKVVSTTYDLFAVADQPELTLDTLLRYTKWQMIRQAGLTRLFDGKHYGNPCFFHAQYRQELLVLEGDSGGKAIFRAHPDEVDLFYVSANELLDIDLPGDWERWENLEREV